MDLRGSVVSRSLPTDNAGKQAHSASLEQLVPRWILIGCVVFWMTLTTALMFSSKAISTSGWGLFGVLMLCSTLIILQVGKSSLGTLQTKLKLLAIMARRDNKDEVPDLTYAEFTNIASEIDEANRVFRDEMEGLRLAAFRDAATGLPNRLSFIAELKKGLAAASENAPCTIFHLITNGYQGADDLLGTTGNQRLQSEISSRLSLYLASTQTSPGNDWNATLVASIGPDQFGLFMPAGNGRDQAKALAHDLRQLFRQPFNIDGRKIQVNISGGLAVAPDDGHVAELLLKNAGLALNEILRAGKVGFQFFSPRLERLALGRARFEQQLRDAVQAQVFYPVYQPKIDLITGKIIGVEALARWKHTDGKTISPGTFIPLAEELGLIDQIGFQILKQACSDAAKWRANGHEISVAVNVSPKQFERSDFIDQVVDALRSSRLPPRLLQLEITETMAVSNPDRVINTMKPLRSLGIKLAVDDFGTGHANLSLLTQIPFDIFKIDRQFVAGLGKDAHAPAIIEMILAMADTLGLETVAEGIETREQEKVLLGKNCNLGQGFLYSPGITDEDLRELFKTWGHISDARKSA